MNRLSAIIIALTAACCAMFVPQPAAAQESIYTYEWVVEPKFKYLDRFSEGLAAVKINDKWGYIDKTGKIVIEPQFEGADRFRDGLAAVKLNDKLGIIDQTGKFIIEPKFQYRDSYSGGVYFSEGLAKFGSFQYGYIDNAGKVVIEPKFYEAKHFHEGLAAVEQNGKWGYIDKTGKIVIEPQFEEADRFSDGLAAVKLNDKWGIIDKTGKFIIEPKLGTPSSTSSIIFTEGMAAVRLNGKCGYIDQTGEVVIEPQFRFANEFHEGLAAVEQNGKWGYIDKMGNFVIEPQFEKALAFDNGLAVVSKSGFYKIIDKMGRTIAPKLGQIGLKDIGTISEGMVSAQVANNNYYGYIRIIEIKTLDDYIKTNIKPIISAADYIKPKVEHDINVWQQKGEFESTALWQQRVNEQTRSKKIEELTAKYRAEHNAMLEQYKEEYKNACQKYYALKENTKRAAFDSSNLVLSTYDADNQSFMITSKTAFADILLSVPVAEAPSFKQNWNTIKKTAELKYMPSGDDVALTSVSFYNGTKKYTYDGTSDIKYAITDIDYNFRPIEIALSNDNNIDYDFDPIGNAGGSVVQSPAAKDLADNKNRIDHRKLSAGTSSDVDNNIPKTAETNKNTFAVIIANETYRREANVDFALNDGKVFRQYCHNTLGIPESNIRYIENATLNDMKVDINWITEVAKAYKGEAQIIFYYAGHGIPDEQSGAAYLLPVDGYGSDLSTGYSLGDLYEKFSDAPAKSTVLLLDACFSGAKRGGGMMTSARGVAIKAKAAQPGGNLIVFSAAQGDETAYPYIEKGHGMFTYFLLKKLQDSKGEASLSEIGDYIIDNVRRESIVRNQKSQTPTVTTSLSIGPVWKSLKLK